MFKLVNATIAGLVTCIGIWAPVQAEPLLVGAPPSLRPVFHEILPMFEQEHDATVQITYTPSRTLAKEVERGTTVIDVFLGAGSDEIEQLHKKGLTLNGRPRVYARTSLVLAKAVNSRDSLMTFPEAFQNPSVRIVLGDPRTSSLGDITAREMMKFKPTYKNRPNLLFAAHSEEILDMIRDGKADLGLVYRIDTINGGQVRISDETPFDRPVQVRFEQAVVSTCRAPLRKVAEDFSDFLMTSRIQKLLVKYGFEY